MNIHFDLQQEGKSNVWNKAVQRKEGLVSSMCAQELDQRRHLLRLWVCPPPPDRPLPPAFAELFDTVEVGKRRGIHVPGYKLTTPFDGE